jgi:GT2 family glycosyltransferase
VIPTAGRRESLGRVLARLRGQRRRSGEFEVLVVRDATAQSPLGEQLDDAPRGTRTVAAKRPGASAARNAGWRAARGEVVLFLDDDIAAGPNLVDEHLGWHARHPEPTTAVLGHVAWSPDVRVTPFMRWLEHGTQFDFHSIRGEAGWGNFYTANVSLKREMLERTDGFDEDRFPFLYEDTDLGYRLREHGFRLLYHRRAEAEHLHATTLADWQGRMGAIARAERTWIALHPELEPHFHDRLVDAGAWPPSDGRLARAAVRFVPPRAPIVGRWVSERASVYYRQQLAPAFLAAWTEAQEEAPERSASSGGSPPGGP